jgi:hypothetical protein
MEGSYVSRGLFIFITMQQAFVYSIRIWLTSVFLPPLISNLIFMLLPDEGSFLELAGLFLIQLLIGGLLSFCSFLFLFVFTYLFIKQNFVEINVKISLSIIGFVLAIIPIIWLTGWQLKFDRSLIYFSPYPLVVIVGIWFYNLQPFKDDESVTE